jgi:hypothetical protein
MRVDSIDEDEDEDDTSGEGSYRLTKAKISRKRDELVMSEKHCEIFISNIENLLRAMRKEKKDIQNKLHTLEKLGSWENERSND